MIIFYLTIISILSSYFILDFFFKFFVYVHKSLSHGFILSFGKSLSAFGKKVVLATYN